MLLFHPILAQAAEDPQSPWMLPGAAVFVIVLARWFFFRQKRNRSTSAAPSATSSSSEPAVTAASASTAPAKAVAKRPVQTHPVPGTDLQYLTFAQPSIAPYAQASSCYDKDLHPALAEELKKLGSNIFALLAADSETVLVQNREGVCRWKRSRLKEIQLHPVLPAKGSGMVVLQFRLEQDGKDTYRDFVIYFAHSQHLQRIGHEKAEEVAEFLNLPLTVSEESYDC